MAGNQLSIPFEEWKEIPGFPGYTVSTHGRVRSYWKRLGYGSKYILGSHPRRYKSLEKCKNGYLRVTLRKNQKNHKITVHRLILITFVGPCPKGMEACHNDGVRNNNHLENLRWDTRSQNHLDKREHGTMLRGESHHWTKLTEEQIHQIRNLSKEGYPNIQLSKMFLISDTHIADIIHRKTWEHI